MAEEEIRKHAKAAYQVLKDPEKGWKQKLGGMIGEILIIVFAVSVSIWFHSWAEGRKDKSEEKEFLVGLKGDIQADMREMQLDLKSFDTLRQGIQYFGRVGGGEILNKDSLNIYSWLFYGESQINPRISRFEALKGSGRLDIIENKELLLHTTDLYQKNFPQINRINDHFNSLRSNIILPLLASHLQLDATGSGTNWQEVLRLSQMRLLISQGEGINHGIIAYTDCIDKCRLIIDEIEKELK